MIDAPPSHQRGHTIHDSRALARSLIAALVVALAARGTAMFIFAPQLRQDPDHYGIIAANIVQHGCYCSVPGHPTAFRPPLYPLLLAPWSAGGEPIVAAIVLLHLLLGAMMVAGVYLLALPRGGGRSALAASLIVAIDPLLVMQSTFVMTETLAATLAVLGVLALTRLKITARYSAVMTAGLAVGLAVLCRPTFLFWVPLILVGTLTLLNGAWRVRLRYAALLVLIIGLTLLPWVIRNWIVLGRPIIATTHGGYTMWLANNDAYYDYLLGERLDFSAALLDQRQRAILQQHGFDEVRADGQYQRLALETIGRRPTAFAYSCLWRVAKLWHPLPEPRSADESRALTVLRFLAAGWYVLVYLAAIVAVVRQRGVVLRELYWGISLCLAFTLVHSVYWTDIRMRAPLMPAVALLAGLALAGRTAGRSPAGQTR